MNSYAWCGSGSGIWSRLVIAELFVAGRLASVIGDTASHGKTTERKISYKLPGWNDAGVMVPMGSYREVSGSEGINALQKKGQR